MTNLPGTAHRKSYFWYDPLRDGSSLETCAAIVERFEAYLREAAISLRAKVMAEENSQYMVLRFEGGSSVAKKVAGELRMHHVYCDPDPSERQALNPIQHEIRKLEDELNSFNERISELENEGHRGHAMEVLKANAIDFARRIDELRCVLVESSPRDAPGGRSPKRSNRNCPGSPLVGSGSK